MTLEKFMEPYLVPQENSNRMEVRWFALKGKGAGVLIVGHQALNISAWPYSQAQIEKTKHWFKLKKENKITVNVDLRTMGVGGNDSWTDVSQPLEQYQIPSQNYSYGFRIIPMGRNGDVKSLL